MVNPNQAARPAYQYVLGHSEHEVERLKAQARLIDPITERFLLAAGVGPGIRNLEFLRRTEVVGPKGNKVRLLDAVDMITGVSGGSFTALAYGLYGDRLFSEYEQRLLKRNVQGVDRLRAAAGRIVLESPDFQLCLTDLGDRVVKTPTPVGKLTPTP